ncbi:uncharacterized protein M6B38_379065 [Iris pallida]|uniref:Uncharacterized protein n=1 Tax=Iris pallida TaxID=29817 RepID=A0AAX6G939_IRIPA|nr:uncharacterized protein M6B38_379065 [Iris pallida]
MQDPFPIPSCFSAATATSPDRDPAPAFASNKPGQSAVASVYRTKIAGHSRLITVTWTCTSLLARALPRVRRGRGQRDKHLPDRAPPLEFLAADRLQEAQRPGRARPRLLGPPQRQVLRRARAPDGLLRRAGPRRRAGAAPRRPEARRLPEDRPPPVRDRARLGVEEGARLREEALRDAVQVRRQGEAPRHIDRVLRRRRRRRRRRVDDDGPGDGGEDRRQRGRPREAPAVEVQGERDRHGQQVQSRSLLGRPRLALRSAAGLRHALFIFKPLPAPHSSVLSSSSSTLPTLSNNVGVGLFLYAWKLE